MNLLKRIGKNTFSSLQIRNYRLYFIGQSISLCGTWMQTIGQGLLVLQLTGSGTALGLVTALQFLPILFLGPYGGIIADRFSKRKILFISQATAGLLALILGLLVLSGSIRLWMVYFLALCLGLVNTFDNPVRQSFVVEMVGHKQVPNAVSLNSSLVNLARIIGPVFAGVLIAAAGLAVCFLVNAVSYIAVLIVLFLMRPQDLLTAPRTQRAKGQLREGFRYVRSTPVLRNTLLMMAIIGTLSYEFQVILPLFAEFTFHGNARTYADLTAAMGLGALIGGLISANRKNISSSMIVTAAFIFGITMLLVSIAPSLPVALAAMVLVGIFSINYMSLSNTTLQLESAPGMRGRVMALWSVAFLGSTPIGGPIVGWLGEHIGPRWGLAVGGFAAIAAAGIGAALLKNGKHHIQPNIEVDPTESPVERTYKIS